MNKRQQDTLNSKKKELELQLSILRKLAEINPSLLGIEKAIEELDKKIKTWNQ